MMYKIPIIGKEPDITGTEQFRIFWYVGDGKWVYAQLERGDVRPSWVKITEEEFYSVVAPEYPQITKSTTTKPYQPTNAEVAQMISDLQVDLIIAGVI